MKIIFRKHTEWKTRIFQSLIILIFLLHSLSPNAATIYWDGEAGDGQWNTLANWVGNILPAATDDVILDNSVFNTNYTVILPAGNSTVQVNSLTITPSGALLIQLILPTFNTANPGLSVTGTGIGLVLNNNAILKNSSGASAGSGISITGSFRINDGAHYIHNTGRGNATIVSKLSTAAGTETGIFEFDVPVASYVLSLSNRTYGSLVLSSGVNSGTVTYSGSGASALNVQGDLQINTGVNFAISMSANLIIKGNFNQSALSTFNLQTSTNNNVVHLKGNLNSEGTITESNSGLPVFELDGSSIQDINAANAIFTNNVDFRLNNVSGANLVSGLNLPYRLSISSGNLSLGNFNLSTSAINQISPPTQTMNHIVTNGSGNLKLLAVNAATLFPFGPTANSYNPVTISSGNGADYSVRVEQVINPAIALPTYAINRTWYLQSSVVTAGVGLKFQYASADANAGAAQPQPMEFLLYSGNAWSVINGNTNLAPSGADPSWTITSSSGITVNNSSTPFALGVNGGWSLPLFCDIQLSGKRMVNSVNLEWGILDCEQAESFEVLRSINGLDFAAINNLPRSVTNQYRFSDLLAPNIILFYKISIKGKNGFTKFSNVLRLGQQFDEFNILLSPNPAHDNLDITMQSRQPQTIRFFIVNQLGQPINVWSININPGITKKNIEVGKLAPGNYVLVAESANGTKQLKFFKY